LRGRESSERNAAAAPGFAEAFAFGVPKLDFIEGFKLQMRPA
jgi:hypothetical protein